jgi:hypothetical protein
MRRRTTCHDVARGSSYVAVGPPAASRKSKLPSALTTGPDNNHTVVKCVHALSQPTPQRLQIVGAIIPQTEQTVSVERDQIILQVLLGDSFQGPSAIRSTKPQRAACVQVMTCEPSADTRSVPLSNWNRIASYSEKQRQYHSSARPLLSHHFERTNQLILHFLPKKGSLDHPGAQSQNQCSCSDLLVTGVHHNRVSRRRWRCNLRDRR